MRNQYLSEPLADLLQRSTLAPGKINNALERLAGLGIQTILKPGHVYLRQIRAWTGINVVGIARRHGKLLVEIEQFKDGLYQWRYHERSRIDCQFACKGHVPHTIGCALVGRPLRSLIMPTPALGEVSIDSLSHDEDGWLTLTVTPEWHQL